MQRFFKKSEQNDNQKDIYLEAIAALTKLTKHYQQSEPSTPESNINITLEFPWYKQPLFGGNNFGIAGKIAFTSSSPSASILEHPFGIALINMGFRKESFSYTNAKTHYQFSGVFSLYDENCIAQIPEKCQKLFGENKKNFTI